METVVNKFFDLQVYRDFMRPEYCKNLLMIGVTGYVPYQWKITANDVLLHTNAFDVDEYYKEAWKNVDSINKYEILPAYTGGDVFVFLASIEFEFNIMYTKELFHVYPASSKSLDYMRPVHCKRLPDAFAQVLMHLITSGFITAEAYNKFLDDKLLSSVGK